MKARKDISALIQVPSGINAKFENAILTMKKEKNELTRKIDNRVNLKLVEDKITIEVKQSTKKQRKIFGTTQAHIKNMIKGLTEGFSYKLEISTVHFPMTVSVNKSDNTLIVKNFLGEKKDRIIKLIAGVDVKINKNEIELQGSDVEKAGQCAANIEKGTKVTKRDRRIFQDGIFITHKPKRSFL